MKQDRTIPPNRPEMPRNILPTTDTPQRYSPEYLEDGRVWLLKDGERLRLLANYHEFARAAQMAGGYADLKKIRMIDKDKIPEAPFVWFGPPDQFDPPADVPPSYLFAFRWAWPPIEISVSIDHAMWKLWTVVKNTRHASFIRESNPVTSWFEGWLDHRLVFYRKGTRYIRLRDLRSEMGRLAALMKAGVRWLTAPIGMASVTCRWKNFAGRRRHPLR